MSQNLGQYIPAGAYALVQRPNMRELMQNLKKYEVMDFIYRFPELNRQADLEIINKCYKKILGVGVGGLALGIALNVYLKRISPRILTAPLYARIGFRSLLAVTPVVLGAAFVTPVFRRQIDQVLVDSHGRIVQLGVDGDVEKYFAS